jgi:DNA-binding ferritin-like protein
MALSLFPEDMMRSSGMSEMTLEGIASKLTYFHEQLHLLHWQTQSYAEHQALGSLYDQVHDFKDDVIEKLMGYMGKRPKAFKMQPIVDMTSSTTVVQELKGFAHELMEWAETNQYCDVENMAQDLSGKAAKTLYLLTLS